MSPDSDSETATRHKVAKNIMQWAKDVREDADIDQKFRKLGAESQLRVGDAEYNPGSGVSHTEFLHLRAVWYHYPHLREFDELFQDDPDTGYKGYVTPHNRELASRICDKTRPPQWDKYFEAIARERDVLESMPECGYFSMVRYWQSLVYTHTNNKHEVTEEEAQRASKIVKPTLDPMESMASSFKNKLVVSKAAGKQPAAPGTPPPKRPAFRMPEGTPQVQSYQPARGNAANRPSADETYVNVALLLFLQAITKELPGPFRLLHWAAPRIPLKLTGSDKKTLMEARVDGYLCRSDEMARFDNVPLAICEAKPFVRSAGETSTQRQEAAEMACWICQDRGEKQATLQSSASGKKRYEIITGWPQRRPIRPHSSRPASEGKFANDETLSRRLMISQDRHEIYIIIGEYGKKYEDYIRGNTGNTGPRAPLPASTQRSAHPRT
jgi:hypothetical protein